MKMHVSIRLFASHREATGRSSLSVEMPEHSSAADVFATLNERFPALRNHANGIAFAINQEQVSPTAEVRDGDELAILPPMAGG